MIKRRWVPWSQRYQVTLQSLARDAQRCGAKAQLLGCEAQALGLRPADLIGIHTIALSTLVRANDSAPVQERRARIARKFLSLVLKRMVELPRASLNRHAQTMARRAAGLEATNRYLKQGLRRRKSAEEALEQSGRQCARLLQKSRRLQEQLRRLTHKLLSRQESERRVISRELQDEVAQTLLGINVRLVTLKQAVRGKRLHLQREIRTTRRLVEDSVLSINRFAHALRRQPEAQYPTPRPTTKKLLSRRYSAEEKGVMFPRKN